MNFEYESIHGFGECLVDYSKHFHNTASDIDTRKEVEKILLKDKLLEVIETLRDRERTVLIEYFGLFGSEQKSLEQTGKQLNIKRERTRQLLARALRMMRHRTRSIKLLCFYEFEEEVKKRIEVEKEEIKEYETKTSAAMFIRYSKMITEESYFAISMYKKGGKVIQI